MNRHFHFVFTLAPCIVACCLVGCGDAPEDVAFSSPPVVPSDPLIVNQQPQQPGEVQVDPDLATQEVMSVLSSTPAGRDAIDRIGGKDVALTRFQQANGISERIAEAAIKEWVLTHNWNWEWDLGEVKQICLRNRDHGIPHEYLPESEKE